MQSSRDLLKIHTRFILILFLILISISSCGRKNRSIFSFNKDEKPSITERLMLPAVRIGRVVRKEDTIQLRWKPPYKIKQEKLAGYFIYRVSQHGIISKKPLNDQPICICEYSEPIIATTYGYVIKVLYLVDGEGVVSPASRVIFSN